MDGYVSVERVPEDPVSQRDVEFVERKGIGHPDSLCDGVAEAVSRRLSQFYRTEYGRVYHHNTDKVHLGAGSAEPAYGGGEVVDPIYVLVGGRATTRVDGERVPVDDIATEAAREYLLETVPDLSSEHVEIETRIGETSADLHALFERGDAPLANDTSFGVGHAPLSPTERFVRTLEPRMHGEIEAVGKDVKLLAVRQGAHVSLTVAAAVLDSYVDSLHEYDEVIARLQALTADHASESLDYPFDVTVNAADDPSSDSVYLTTTGLSAEAGDDGSVGRGNRANGLITPQRPMSLEATAGKNPVTHVGKLYNLLSLRVARRLESDVGAEHASIGLVSCIGEPVTDPLAVDVVTTTAAEDEVRTIVEGTLADVDALTEDVIAGRVDTF